MSEKLSTIILKVDLQCVACTKKIKKTLCNLQDRERIRSVSYDEKNNSVTITGPFDPRKLIKKICCKACKVIKDIQIVVEEEKPPPPPQPEPAPKPAPEPAPEPAPPAPAPEPEPEPPKPEPQPAPPKVEPEPPQPEPVTKPPPEPAYPKPDWTPGSGCCCCCRPWIEAYYGGCRCCSCGWIGPYGPVNCGPPPFVYDYKGPPYEYGGPCYGGTKTCEFICEEQPPSCGIM